MKLHHFRPKKEKRGLLYQVFIIVAIIQVVLLITMGSVIVTQSIITEEKKFDAPPTIEKVDQARKETRVRVQQQQKKTQKLTRRISITNPQNTNLPQVNITLPPTMSMGAGISAISNIDMTSKFNIVTTTVDIGGIKSKTEKVLICIDTGKYLMTDERGGLDTYKAIREDIKKLINNLPPTVLFNLMAYSTEYGTSINMFQPSLVAATSANKRMACDFVEPLNASLSRLGPGGNNYKLKYPFLPQPPDSNHYSQYASNIYRIYQAALEQGADTIYILTTSWTDPERIKKPWNNAQTQRYVRDMARYSENVERQRRQAGWNDQKQIEYEREDMIACRDGIKKAREWIKAENDRRAKKGQPLYTGNVYKAMYDNKFYVRPKEVPPSIGVKAPEVKFESYGRSGILKYYDKLFKEVYRDKQMKPPTLNMIVFRGKNENLTPAENRVIKQFTSSNNGGRSRVLRGLKPVKEYD
ncbi:MAG: hypothetical protein BHW65_07925 [Verrucomicrobia bacterium CAG:312_58_20]|nr:MAG: hypothetical protein BHW65_07925 [Verrucomicrobia bacterium CAG:312_58_20]